MEAARTPADWGTGRSSHGGIGCPGGGPGPWRECEPATGGRQAFGQQPLFTGPLVPAPQH